MATREIDITSVHFAEECIGMEQDAREILDRLANLAKRMERNGLPAIALLPGFLKVWGVADKLSQSADLSLLASSLQGILNEAEQAEATAEQAAVIDHDAHELARLADDGGIAGD